MEKLLSVSLGLALATTALGQGQVRFSNASADIRSPPDRLVRFRPGTPNPFGTNDAPVVNWGSTSFRAQLYYGASTDSEGQLIPVSAAPALFRASTTTTEPGTWTPLVRTFTGFDESATLNLQVRVWDSQYGSTYELAELAGSLWIGRSVIFPYTIPLRGVGPVSAYAMSQFVGFYVGIPEPGTLALTALGIVALLIFRRRRL